MFLRLGIAEYNGGHRIKWYITYFSMGMRIMYTMAYFEFKQAVHQLKEDMGNCLSTSRPSSRRDLDRWLSPLRGKDPYVQETDDALRLESASRWLCSIS